MRRISSSAIPRVVTAGVPIRMPLVTAGFSGSKGMAFLFTVIPAFSSPLSATLPVSPFGLRSTSMRWVSVPPATSRKSKRLSSSASATAFRWIWRWYARNSSLKASLRATALAAMMCIRGPPWNPGKRFLLRTAAYSSWHMIMPPLGPRSVLWVVVVTNSA